MRGDVWGTWLGRGTLLTLQPSQMCVSQSAQAHAGPEIKGIIVSISNHLVAVITLTYRQVPLALYGIFIGRPRAVWPAITKLLEPDAPLNRKQKIDSLAYHLKLKAMTNMDISSYVFFQHIFEDKFAKGRKVLAFFLGWLLLQLAVMGMVKAFHQVIPLGNILE